ncbi:GNAT family N-acetyltransferase [Streptomyces drozdowiczii]|uniref:GNAT family N-acetyltransferase n=1 Tax=Streptomyces drozdowiczii TaxID=202862 RepID=A0ABY6PT69_9ACTN|nr:GNAT family N-acetyltransferase [Streptomyces drozdowiczii]MCX0244796.1 GNAT family N-acetyltransferase [Streptomyces drozdowiczii]UZK55477.1 GNAT family N-acetyltransferase [Streptomyces drozdowiczii]
MTPSLRSERLVLEPYVPADEEAFVALFLDPRVSRWMGDGPWPEERYRTTFSRIFTHAYGTEGFDVWAVRQGGRTVGHAEIKPAEAVEGHELIYGLAPEAWGQGLGTELARTITAYGFEVLGLDQVYATVAEPNTASLAALRKVGFEHVRDITEEDGSTTLLLAAAR